jgi:hypothetical protein
MTTVGATRRGALGGAVVSAAALMAGRAAWAQMLAGKPAAAPHALYGVVCDLVIPATDTPGAVAAGVPAFMQFAAEHALLGVTPGWERMLGAELRGAGGADFLSLSGGRQATVLTALDRAAFARGAAGRTKSVWPAVKAVILAGYYTSEIGGARELVYDLVPGHFDGALPVTPGFRVCSSDWDGVSLG